MISKVTIEGIANVSANSIICVCQHCNHHDLENTTIEINFCDKKIYSLCSQCKKMNELNLAINTNTFKPLPRTKTA